MSADERRGFNQYDILWRGSSFEFTAEKLVFYGSWRMTQDDNDNLFFVVDLYVKLPRQDLFIRSIRYENDPSVDLRSLNADICAAVNEWLYDRTGQRRIEIIEDLEKRAQQPVIHIQSVQKVDNILLELKTARDEALRRGEQRIARFKGSHASEPTITVVLDFGKRREAKPISFGPTDVEVRRIITEAIEERATEMDVKQKTEISDLLQQLARAQTKKAARQIRVVLRRLGHQGALATAPTKQLYKEGQRAETP